VRLGAPPCPCRPFHHEFACAVVRRRTPAHESHSDAFGERAVLKLMYAALEAAIDRAGMRGVVVAPRE
jgi:hypothetical protein